jgi:uncharacterized protein YbjT (DUF2867 family)
MRLAVAGGTGVVGQHVVAAAEAAGHETVTLSRRTGTDLLTGDGLAAALDGSHALIDVANTPTLNRSKAVSFFEITTQNMLAAERAAGVGHHVALSIVGIDRVPSGYYEGKRRQEALVAAGDVPWSILRATQFHEFPGQLLARLKSPIVLAPRMRSATVSAREVAEHLVALATAEPHGRAPDLSGPEVHEMPDLMQLVLAAQGRRRPMLAVRIPGKAGKAMATGGLLPTEPGSIGKQTFADWLKNAQHA